MIDINLIKGRGAITLLGKYSGINPYLRQLKIDYEKNGKIKLTEGQIKYINDFYSVPPLVINKLIRINPLLGQSLKEKDNLTFVPEKILVQAILADQEKTFHVYGKVKQNQNYSKMYWLPKTLVLDDPYFTECDITIDWDKYTSLDILGRQPYDHQRTGVEFLACRNGAILADDMGLGKCYQSIVAALEKEAKKILIVCPASVKITWERELEFFGEKSIIVNGSRWPDVGKYTIINYDILKNFHTIGPQTKDENGNLNQHNRQLVNEKYDLIIVDEAHKVKDHKSQRGQIINELVLTYGIDKVWLLTGTPIANRPMDFYNLLKLVGSPIADNWKFFAQRYCEGKSWWKPLGNGKRRQIWVTKGASNLDELAIRTKNLLIRRMKGEIEDMPDKTVTTNYYNLSKRGIKEYEGLWDDYVDKKAEEGKRVRPLSRDLVELGLLRKFIAMETIPYTVELAKDAIEQGQKVIIFTTFTDELNEIADNFGKECVTHNGKMNSKDKQISIDKFQTNDKVKVFVGNIQSAGVGITLTEGTIVIFNSFDWVPGNNEQAEDRCIFGGQHIMTQEGYKLIEEIEIGDMIYTHLGNFKPVINKFTHLERKKSRVDINAFGFNQPLSVTQDHKIYVYNSDSEHFEWVEAIKLDIRKHFLTLKSNKQPKNRKEFLPVNNYITKTFKNNFGVKQKNGRLTSLPTEILLTNELLYAFGFFIAEGWANDINNKKSASVNVCQKIINKKMYDASKYIIDIFKDSFNISNHSEYIDKYNVKTCTIYSKNLALNFIDWFGKGVKNKKMPIWVDELNNEQLKSLFNGFNHGDGYFRGKTQQNITASTKLGSELVRYSANLGNNVSFSIRNINNIPYYQTEHSIDNNSGLNRIVKIDNYIIYPIKSLHISKPKRGEERVYDLSIKDDHSFVVGNYNVHNCFRIGQKNNVTVYYQLFTGTISLVMWYVLMKKQDVINQIISRGDEDGKRLKMLLDNLEENGLTLE